MDNTAEESELHYRARREALTYVPFQELPEHARIEYQQTGQSIWIAADILEKLNSFVVAYGRGWARRVKEKEEGDLLVLQEKALVAERALNDELRRQNKQLKEQQQKDAAAPRVPVHEIEAVQSDLATVRKLWSDAEEAWKAEAAAIGTLCGKHYQPEVSRSAYRAVRDFRAELVERSQQLEGVCKEHEQALAVYKSGLLDRVLGKPVEELIRNYSNTLCSIHTIEQKWCTADDYDNKSDVHPIEARLLALEGIITELEKRPYTARPSEGASTRYELALYDMITYRYTVERARRPFARYRPLADSGELGLAESAIYVWSNQLVRLKDGKVHAVPPTSLPAAIQMLWVRLPDGGTVVDDQEKPKA